MHLLHQGAWIVLSGTAARIWELIEYRTKIDRLSDQLAAEFLGAADRIALETKAILADLAERGLVHLAEDQPNHDATARDQYLRLLKRALVNDLYPEFEVLLTDVLESCGYLQAQSGRVARQRYLRDVVYRNRPALDELRTVKWNGSLPGSHDVQGLPHTQVGLLRLDHLERCAEQVFAERVPGDFLEAGVCRGGASIFMRGLQCAWNEPDRRVWLADSFAGVPPPSAAPDVEANLDLSEAQQPWLACDLETVRSHFVRYGLLDGHVRFLPGWFHRTLPNAPVESLAILRVDADLYSSTSEALEHLYGRLSPGGFVTIDDYGALGPCRQAVDEFRARHAIVDPLERIDWTAVAWRKTA